MGESKKQQGSAVKDLQAKEVVTMTEGAGSTPEPEALATTPEDPAKPKAKKDVQHVTTGFSAELLGKLQEAAQRQSLPLATVVRQAVTAHLGGEAGKGSGAEAKADALLVALGEIEGKLQQMATAVDRLYADTVRAADRLHGVVSAPADKG